MPSEPGLSAINRWTECICRINSQATPILNWMRSNKHVLWAYCRRREWSTTPSKVLVLAKVRFCGAGRPLRRCTIPMASTLHSALANDRTLQHRVTFAKIYYSTWFYDQDHDQVSEFRKSFWSESKWVEWLILSVLIFLSDRALKLWLHTAKFCAKTALPPHLHELLQGLLLGHR